MKSEQRSLVRGSELPKCHSAHTSVGDLWRGPARSRRVRLTALCVMWYSDDSVVRKRARIAGILYPAVLILVRFIQTYLCTAVSYDIHTWYSHCACASMPTGNARPHVRAIYSSIIHTANRFPAWSKPTHCLAARTGRGETSKAD